MMFDKLKAWADQGYFAYYGAGWNDNQKMFEENKAALWIGSSGSFGGLKKTAQMPFSADLPALLGFDQGPAPRPSSAVLPSLRCPASLTPKTSALPTSSSS